MSNRTVNLAASLAALAVGAALPLNIAPARADSAYTLGCVGTRGSVSCVAAKGGRSNPHIIKVPEPVSDEERAAAEARDRRWTARCRPQVRQDGYGVPRYVYAAQGCEYGRLD